MAEIKKLDMDLEIVGWDRSGGRSLNVWGRVPFPKELYDLIKINEKHGRKASIWTAYDSALYGKNAYTLEELPRISATYKSCFEKYSAVVENMGMRIAAALDMPTSYNYIVAFNPEDYPKVISNYPNPEKKLKELQPFGIVSIDFLQNQRTKPIVTKTDYEVDGETKEIDSIREFEKDILITFDDALRKYNFSGAYTNTDNRGNLIENWISVVDEMAKVELKGCPRETINKTISNIHSRIARAFLLREFLGDCDFTAYNGGIVYNPATKKMRYAPNHDYGEVCNPLVAKKLSKPIDSLCGMTQEAFDQLPDAVKQAIIRGQQKKNNATIPEIAQEFASSTSA